MTNQVQAIEVEVVEVDGITAPARFEPREESPSRQPGQDWRQWQGRVRTLDSRWWPLWVFLGAIALVLLLTLGVVIGVIFIIFRIIKGILNAIFG
ncbi:MAG: hypothetical protein ABIS50_05230 [Luteolibacter sp.]|uniref:hypothetical protein n=1 Tax=Luteolibacter sp. TaxID=1962973 RepID=UPI003264F476